MNVRKALIPTLVVAVAVPAPAALAGRPDDRAGVRGPTRSAADPTTPAWRPALMLRSDALNREYGLGGYAPGTVAAQQSSSIRPDDRAGVRGSVSASERAAAVSAAVKRTVIGSTSGRPDDRAGMRGPDVLASSIAQPSSTGFDWGDALIGGVGGVGTTLALMGLLFLVTSRRSTTRTA